MMFSCITVASNGGTYTDALFYAVAAIMLNATPELVMAAVKLPVYYEQRDFLFFPSWAYALPAWIVKIPITFVEVGIWVFLSYYHWI